MSYSLGRPQGELRLAMVLATEAVRACCRANLALAVRLLRLALYEAETASARLPILH
jgi:hypothetical protein